VSVQAKEEELAAWLINSEIQTNNTQGTRSSSRTNKDTRGVLAAVIRKQPDTAFKDVQYELSVSCCLATDT